MRHQWNDNDRGQPEVLEAKRVSSDNLPTKKNSYGLDWALKPGSTWEKAGEGPKNFLLCRNRKNLIERLKISKSYDRSIAANISSSNQNIPHTSRNMKVHYCVNNSTLLVHILYFHLL